MKILTQAKYSTLALALTGLLATPAFAKHGHYSGENIERAKVVQVTPTYRKVTIEKPKKQCWYRDTGYQDYSYNRNHSYHRTNSQNHDDAAAPIIGAVIGGAIGNQFGKGKGNAVATIAGAVIGGALANEAAAQSHNNYNNRNYGTNDYRYHDKYERGHGKWENHHKRAGYNKHKKRKVCEVTHVRAETINELTGYDVSYRYKGEIYYTHMQNHPGKFIDVAVNVTPLE